MAIPQGSLSSVLQESSIASPEDIRIQARVSYESGPIDIEDTAEGLLYQTWILTWDYLTDDFTAVGMTSGGPGTIVLNVADVLTMNFTFDQAGRITIAYTTSTSSYLYWYDTDIASTTTTDLTALALGPVIQLDDKRNTQNTVNDMLLWYTKAEGGGTFELFMLRQRDRFLTEYSMATGIEDAFFIHNIGMTAELRIQIEIKTFIPS